MIEIITFIMLEQYNFSGSGNKGSLD